MKATQRAAIKAQPRWGRATLLLGLLAMALCTVWMGCSPARNYKTLSFFFDGVPDPNAPAGRPEQDEFPTDGKPRMVVVSTHKPFAENKCDSCHRRPAGGTFEPSSVTTAACMECHKQITREYPVMHAPVVAKACLWCHEPHESQFKSLLRVADATLCLQCHERELLSTEVKEHLNIKSNCIDCHGGHGSQKPGMLRPAAAMAAPTTRPGEVR